MKNLNIVLGLIFVLSIGFGVLPMRNDLQALKKQNEALVVQKKKISEEFKKIQENIHKSSKEETFNNISVGYDQASFLDDIENIINRNRFEVKNIQFSLGSNSTVKAEQIQASFQIQGSRGDIFNFLKEVENNKNFMGVSAFSLGNAKKSKLNTFNVALYSFFQKK